MTPKSVPAPLAPPLGTTLGKYPLLSLVGRGSMGNVYKSEDPVTARPVAVKTLQRAVQNDTAEDFRALFRLEAKTVAELRHPGIVVVYDYGEEPACAYLVMEFLEGRSLRECFEQRRIFSVARAIDVTSQILEALQHAHARGIWHRDIKPANILILGDGRVKITDFGIARSESSPQQHTIMGTPGYIAPETYLTDSFDARIDVFAAGAVLYQLLTGVAPYAGTAEQIMLKVCYEAPPAPSAVGSSDGLARYDAIVLRALARRPEERFESAAQFLQVLRQAHSADPERASEAWQPDPGSESVPGRDP